MGQAAQDWQCEGVPACMQVLHVACDAMLLMPTFCSVRHLLVEQPNLKPVIECLPGLPFLETLSLTMTEDELGGPSVR